MAHVVNDRVKETSTTTGTGTFTLAGASTGFESFAAGIGTGNTTYYCATDGTDFEVGLGTYTTGATNTLSRTTIYSSSNSDAAVNFAAGTKSVFSCAPASRLVMLDASGVLKTGGSTTLPALESSATIKAATGIAVGAATPGAGGVAFPATAVAVADANTLDDYEEGTFTPTLTFGGGATGMTFAARAGRYRKVGSLVYVVISLSLSAKGSSTGDAIVGALPFTSFNAAGNNSVGVFGSLSNLTTASGINSRNDFNTADVYLSQFAGTSDTGLTHANFNDTTSMSLSITYVAA